MTPPETTGYAWLFYFISAVTFFGLGVFYRLMSERIDKSKGISILFNNEKEARNDG